jgi:molybdenum cofactor cytidylyltransferase
MTAMNDHRDNITFVPLVLAAGQGKRLGGNKALMDIDGTPALVRVLAAATGAGMTRPIVVVGHQAEEVRALTAGRGTEISLTIVENPDPERGQTSSVQAGLAAAPADAAAVLLWPVDHALVGPDDVAALAAGAEAHPEATVVLPSYRGRTGHPVLLRRALFAAVLALPPQEPLHNLVRAERPRTHFVERPTDAVLLDLDTRAQVDAALSAMAGRNPAQSSRANSTSSEP